MMDSTWYEQWREGGAESMTDEEKEAIEARDRMAEYYNREVFGGDGEGYPGGPEQRERDQEIMREHHNDFHDGRFGDRYFGQTTAERKDSESVERYAELFEADTA